MHCKLDARRLLSNGRGDGSHSNGQFHRRQHSSPRVRVLCERAGKQRLRDGPVYYGIAGAVGFDLSGNVLGGEQDYNDGQNGFTSPADIITATGSSMTVNPTTGTGTLILNVSASNPNVGVNGIETFAVQFINASHALITQFDGSATSSGSFDLQTATSGADGNFAFTLSGLDTTGSPFAYGGVFSNTSGTIHGTYDENDAGKVLVGNTLTATDNGVGADVYGRGSITGFTDPNNGNAPISLVYYIVGPEVLRIIDVDADDAMAGSAYGQGSATTFDSTVLSTDVFGILDNTEDAHICRSRATRCRQYRRWNV